MPYRIPVRSTRWGFLTLGLSLYHNHTTRSLVQTQNKDKALQLVRAKLYEMERARLQAIRDTQRSQLIGTGERHERIRTYNYPQGRVTGMLLVPQIIDYLPTIIPLDHRVPVTVYGIESMMEGQLLDQIVDALVMKEQEDYIKSLSESD